MTDEAVTNDAKKEVLRLRHRILECTNYYKLKEEAMSDFRRVKSKYGKETDQILELQSLRRDIDKMVNANCQQCGKQIVVKSDFYAKYHAQCSECEDKKEQQESEERLNKERKKAEVNPLIKYCYEINSRAAPYEKGPHENETKEQQLKREEDWYVNHTMEMDKMYEEQDFIREYNPSYGISKAEWQHQRKNKKALIKQERKEQDSDLKLKTSSPTFQILDNFRVIEYDGCTCKAEYLRRGIFCPVCRLMIKVHEYTLQLFKDAAQGRTSYH